MSKHLKTAQAASKNLAEHKRGFLNQNNLAGWLDDPDLDTSGVSWVLMRLSAFPALSQVQVKDASREIRDLTDKAVPLGRAYMYIAQTLGYKQWVGAKMAMAENGGYLKNLNYGKPTDINQLLHSAEPFKYRAKDEHRLRCAVCHHGPQSGVSVTQDRDGQYRCARHRTDVPAR